MDLDAGEPIRTDGTSARNLEGNEEANESRHLANPIYHYTNL